jgi:bzd-type benzoyl-CoA reductase N subunit
MNAMEELTELSKIDMNPYVRDWKDRGNKIVGYVCSYMPEEILSAAGILPLRITGRSATDTSQADSYLSRFNCSFARCCLEKGLQGGYDYLDGIVWVNGCDHIRRCYDNWKAKCPRPFMHMLPIPHQFTPEAIQWFREEVANLKQALEEHFQVKITSEALSKACATYNDTRRLLQQLYELRASDQPPFSGAEVCRILSAGFSIPRTDFNRLLTHLLQDAKAKPGASNGQVRLLIAGSMMDDPAFIEEVEDLGAIVVTDSLCVGTRSFWDLTDETSDPLESLADRYFKHVPCPRMAGAYSARLDFIRTQVERARVQGVILENIKFCDLHGTDNALLRNDLEKQGIPTIELERQYGPLADAGRIRTRVQAFLERIGS